MTHFQKSFDKKQQSGIFSFRSKCQLCISQAQRKFYCLNNSTIWLSLGRHWSSLYGEPKLSTPSVIQNNHLGNADCTLPIRYRKSCKPDPLISRSHYFSWPPSARSASNTLHSDKANNLFRRVDPAKSLPRQFPRTSLDRHGSAPCCQNPSWYNIHWMLCSSHIFVKTQSTFSAQ